MFIQQYFSQEIVSKFQIIFDDVTSKVETAYDIYFDNEFYLTSRCNLLGCVDEDGDIILSRRYS